jgi:hypothetical protein
MRYLNWVLQSNRRTLLAQRAATNLFPNAQITATTPATKRDDETDSTTSSTTGPPTSDTSVSSQRQL